MKNTVIFIVFVLAVLGFLFSISGKKYPQLPADADHSGLTETTTCLNCHGPDKVYPRKPEHPPKEECLNCHKHKRLKRT